MRLVSLRTATHAVASVLFVFIVYTCPDVVWAQAASPFDTGATNLVTSLTTIATPIAVLLVMALGVAAAAGRISWGWPLGVILGIGIIFAAQPIVTWVRGL